MLPSRSEGLSPLLLQALACQCAIVGTTAANIVSDGVEGLISPVEDWKSLAENLNRALRDNALREQLSKNARKLAEKFNFQKSGEEFEKALLQITKG